MPEFSVITETETIPCHNYATARYLAKLYNGVVVRNY